ncbi:MAG: hypothetical protein ACRYGK_12505 [Janthinobacterium lividum]
MIEKTFKPIKRQEPETACPCPGESFSPSLKSTDMPTIRRRLSVDFSSPAIKTSSNEGAFLLALSDWSRFSLAGSDTREADQRMAHCWLMDRAELDLRGLDIPAPPDLRRFNKLKTIKLDSHQYADWGAKLKLPPSCIVDHCLGHQPLAKSDRTEGVFNGTHPMRTRKTNSTNLRITHALQTKHTGASASSLFATTKQDQSQQSVTTATNAPLRGITSSQPFLAVLLDWEKTGRNKSDTCIARDRLFSCLIDSQVTLDLKGLDIPAPPDLSRCIALNKISLDRKQANQWATKLQLPAGCKIAVEDIATSGEQGIAAQRRAPSSNQITHPGLLSFFHRSRTKPAPALQAPENARGHHAVAPPAAANTGAHQSTSTEPRRLLSRILPKRLYDPAPEPGTAERLAWRADKLKRAAFSQGRKEKNHFFTKHPALITLSHGSVLDERKGKEARSYVRTNGNLLDMGSEAGRQAGKYVLRKFTPRVDQTVVVNADEGDFGTFVKSYGSAALNMDALEAAQHREFNLLEISGAGNGCWWRAAWLSALLDPKFCHQPQRLSAAIINALGEDASEMAMEVQALAQAIDPPHDQSLVDQWMKDKSAFRLDPTKPDPGRLPMGLRMENVVTNGAGGASIHLGGDVRIEETLKVLTEKLLVRAGMNPHEVRKLFSEHRMGEDVHIFAMLRQLGANSILYHQPYADPDALAPRTDWLCKVSVPPPAPIADDEYTSQQKLARHVETHKNRAHCTEQFILAVETGPVLLHTGAHFNLLISNGVASMPYR